MDKASLEDVLREARRRDPAALSALVERYSARVFGLLYRLTGLRDTAEELMQETFLRLVRTIDTYQEDGRFESWLFRIAANLARDRARQVRRRGLTVALDGAGEGDRQPSGRMASPAEPPDGALLRGEAGERLARCLAELSEPEREVLLLRHYSGLSFVEIAAVLDVPLGTALARSHRALHRLRAAMKQAGFEGSA